MLIKYASIYYTMLTEDQFVCQKLMKWCWRREEEDDNEAKVHGIAIACSVEDEGVNTLDDEGCKSDQSRWENCRESELRGLHTSPLYAVQWIKLHLLPFAIRPRSLVLSFLRLCHLRLHRPSLPRGSDCVLFVVISLLIVSVYLYHHESRTT